MKHEQQIKKEVEFLLDVFGGGDGGVAFVNLRSFLDEMARRADSGDAAAVEILNITYRFNKMMRYASSVGKKKE